MCSKNISYCLKCTHDSNKYLHLGKCIDLELYSYYMGVLNFTGNSTSETTYRYDYFQIDNCFIFNNDNNKNLLIILINKYMN